MKKAIYYTYEITNKSKNKKYLGQHCTLDLTDGYHGSCKSLNEDIKNGDEYVVTILEHFDNIYDLGDAEYELIKSRNAILDDSYYNKNNGRYYNRYFQKKRPGHSRKMKGKNTFVNRKKEANGFYGKSHSEEAKNQISKSKKGQMPWNVGITSRWINKAGLTKMVALSELDGYISKGWELGRKSSVKNLTIK